MGRLIRFILTLTLALTALPAAASDVAPTARVKRAVAVRAGPATGSAQIDRLAPGDRVHLEEAVSGWYRVRLADGRIGYVSKTWTEVVDDGGPEALAVPVGATKVHVIDVGTGLAVFIEGPGSRCSMTPAARTTSPAVPATASSPTSMPPGPTSPPLTT